MVAVVTIQRVSDVTEREFRALQSNQSKPIIVQGAFRDWPAFQKWSLDYIAEKYGDERVTFRQPHAESTKEEDREWAIREFVQALQSGQEPPPYLNQVKLRDLSKSLRSEIGTLEIAKNNRLNRSRLLPASMGLDAGKRALFIGDRGSGFGMLHWDYSYLDVYISQIRGSKEFLVFSPEDTPYLYPHPIHEGASRIKDINNYDSADYPDLQKATPFRFTLREGETLFVPGGWWHATWMNECSISVAESALSSTNWTQRYRWFAQQFKRQGYSPGKIALFRLYMFGLGRFLNILEKVT